MRFEEAIEYVFQDEGYMSDDVHDSGGLTKYGISQKAYPKLDIANLTKDEAMAIYRKDYWDKAKCEQLPEDLRYPHFDLAVNGGVSRAAKILQKACGVTADGKIGPQTLGACQNLTVPELLLERMNFYCQIVRRKHTQAKFLGGWANRTMAVKERVMG